MDDVERVTATLPEPVIRVVRRAEEALATRLVRNHWSVIVKAAEWTFFYLLFLLGFGYGWVLFFLSVYHFRQDRKAESKKRTPSRGPLRQGRESSVASDDASCAYSPAWTAFPDFDRVEWINQILFQLWPRIDAYSTRFVRTWIEPELHRILDEMQLDQLSGFRIQRVDLGTTPLRLNGIKTYDTKRPEASRMDDEIVLECDVEYAGDAVVLFTLQGVSAQIKDVRLRGTARIRLKPLLRDLPFVCGFEVSFLSMPTLDYGLGGIGVLGEMPGINALIRSTVVEIVRSRFVIPNGLTLHLPLEGSDGGKAKLMLPVPAGLLSLNLKEARNLLRKDKHIGGSGKSDPYALLSIGERKYSFRHQYVAKTVDPVWNYGVEAILEQPAGQIVKIDVYDHDAGSSDDFLGTTSVPVMQVVERKTTDAWIDLGEVKHGQVRLQGRWQEARAGAVSEEGQSAIISVLVDRCADLAGSSPSPRCVLKVTGGEKESGPLSSRTRNKTKNPDFGEGFTISSYDPFNDCLTFEVMDGKGSDNVVGKASIPVRTLMTAPDNELLDGELHLQGGSNASGGKIFFAAKLYCLST